MNRDLTSDEKAILEGIAFSCGLIFYKEPLPHMSLDHRLYFHSFISPSGNIVISQPFSSLHSLLNDTTMFRSTSLDLPNSLDIVKKKIEKMIRLSNESNWK